MSDIVENVLQAEEKANEIINTARKQAAELISASDAEIEKLNAEARDETQTLIRKKVEQAQSDAEQKKTTFHKQLKDRDIPVDDAAVKKCISRIMDTIIAPLNSPE